MRFSYRTRRLLTASSLLFLVSLMAQPPVIAASPALVLLGTRLLQDSDFYGNHDWTNDLIA